jgi:hypothetical protein
LVRFCGGGVLDRIHVEHSGGREPVVESSLGCQLVSNLGGYHGAGSPMVGQR